MHKVPSLFFTILPWLARLESLKKTNFKINFDRINYLRRRPNNMYMPFKERIATKRLHRDEYNDKWWLPTYLGPKG